jgi:hypothetical protein
MSTTTTDNIIQTVVTTNDEEHKFIPISHDLDDDVKSNHKQRYIMLLY